MPEEEKSSKKLVDIDTTGPEVDVSVEEPKEEPVEHGPMDGEGDPYYASF